VAENDPHSRRNPDSRKRQNTICMLPTASRFIFTARQGKRKEKIPGAPTEIGEPGIRLIQKLLS